MSVSLSKPEWNAAFTDPKTFRVLELEERPTAILIRVCDLRGRVTAESLYDGAAGATN
jgi:hypothetical protein